MKKMVVNVCCIFSCFLCGVNNGSTQVFADEVIDDTYKAKDFIGKGIDLSANHVIDTDHCVNYSIFSSNIEEIYYSNNKTKFSSTTYSNNNYENLIKSMSVDLSSNTSVDIDAINDSIYLKSNKSIDFSFIKNCDYNSNSAFGIAKIQSRIQKKGFSYANDIDYLKSNYLSNYFINDCKVLKGTPPVDLTLENYNKIWKKFLSKYGTHIFLQAGLGGECYINYALTSEKRLLLTEGSLTTNFNNALGLNVSSKNINLNASFSNAFKNKFKIINENGSENEFANIIGYGGTAFTSYNFSTAIPQANNWLKTINSSNADLIIDDDLIIVPIWAFMDQNHWTTHSLMGYYMSHQEEYKVPYYHNANQLTYENNNEIWFGGAGNVKRIELPLPSLSILNELGYEQVKFSLQIDARRKSIFSVNDSYISIYAIIDDELFLFKNINTNTTSYVTYNVTDSFHKISDYINKSGDKKFTLKLDAYGTNESFVCKNIKVTMDIK